MKQDKVYMDQALNLAKKGQGWVNPNPMVGAVIVKNGKIIGQGYHKKFGGLHAEREALASCKESAQDATIYVTLEPCCHYGKTPPCTEAIIEAGIKRVVVACLDPNPLVAGQGVKVLEEAGLEVAVGVLEKPANRLLKSFFHYIQTKQPYIILKYAMTLDGKIATGTGDSKWITGEASRYHVHQSRHAYSAIMVGVNTVIADDPSLTARLEEPSKNPIRIICDSHLRTSLASQLVSTAKQVPTIIATCCQDPQVHAPYQDAGIEILVTQPDQAGRVNLPELLTRLGEKGIDSIYVEGGAQLQGSLLDQGLVQEIHTYIGGKVIGGQKALPPIGGQGKSKMSQAIKTHLIDTQVFDQDFLIISEVV